ncbi:hypothetical protein H7J08_00925 [Mycobacterium frederiksbergense]|uniref:hypothetical protein n=1 Tax=Mycolicibacterium frederiksbergense TaxID=117567 RepID=UPI0021F32FEC|nr:hypothetical protein [Mycolicibacterium frederiksbergense]MCV7043240.1 hypothetical protein [Mycolicibacterium frederiksbergense]
MLPVEIQEQLQTALARWQGRGPTPDDDFEAGKALADAAFAVLVWNSNQTD